MPFDPDAFLAEKPAATGFDPDAFLAEGSATVPPQKQESSWTDYVPKAITEMHPEGVKDFSQAMEGFQNLDPRKARDILLSGDPMGPIKQIGNVGKGLLSAAALPFSYFTGAARSLVGHPMAAAGEQVDRLVSSSPRTEQQIFEEMSPGVDLALGAVARRPRSLEGVQGPSLDRFTPIAPTEVPASKGSLFTSAGQEQRAGHVLRQASEDPEALAQALDNPVDEVIPGSKPTVFQQTGDLGIGKLERAAATRDPEEFIARRGEQNAARLDALENVQRTGSPEDVADFVRSEMRSAEARVDGAIRQAEHRAWGETHRLGGQYDPQLYGNVVRRELQMAEDAARQEERALWNAIDPNGDFVARTGPVRAAHNNVYGNMTEAARTTMIDKERELAEVIGNYGPSVPFREMTDLRSAVSTAMREERMAHGNSPAYNRLVQFRSAIENAITRDIFDMAQGRFTEVAAERLAAASAATRQRATTFNAPPIKEILRREGLEGAYKMQEGAVVGRIVSPGPTGYDNATAFIRAVNPQEALPVLRDAAVASMRRASVDRDGVIDPKKLERWRASHEGTLRAIDDIDGGNFSRTLSDAERASRAIEDVAATRAQVMQRFEDRAVAKLIDATDAQDVSRILGGIFSGERSVGRAKEVARMLRGSPEAQEGARRGIVDYIQERFISNTEAGTSEQNLIRADQFQTFIKRNREALLQFFSPEQVGVWQAIADDIRRANRSVSSSKLPGASNTAQDLYSLKMGPQKYSALHRILASGAGAVASAAATGTGFLGYVAGALGANFVIGLRDAGVRNVQEVIRKALLDPAFARDLLQRAAPKSKMRGIKRYSMYQAAGAGQGEE